jgi:hypothetical protein
MGEAFGSLDAGLWTSAAVVGLPKYVGVHAPDLVLPVAIYIQKSA